MGKPGSPPAAGSADFLKIAEEYRSTSAGERALLLAAGNLFAEGKYAEAKTRFDEFLQRYGGSSLAAVAALGSASSLDAQDKLDDALAAYQRVVNQYSNDPAAQRARLAIATLHEAKNQPELAFKVLDELSKQPGAGSAVMEAAARKERLEKRYPNVTFTNTAVLPATAAGLQSATTVLPVVPKAGAAATPGSATNAPLGPAK